MYEPTLRTAVVYDRYPLWHEAVEHVLSRVDIAVVGRAVTPSAAVALVDRLRPDLLVADVERPEEHDLLRAARRRTTELVRDELSMRADPDAVRAALDGGAAAYVVKSAHPEDLASAVRQAFDHSVYLAGYARAPLAPTRPVENDRSVGLTKRELEILRLVADGHSNAELGRMLWVTEQTVKFHLSNVYRKLGVANRTEAARWAQVHGLLPPVADVARNAA